VEQNHDGPGTSEAHETLNTSTDKSFRYAQSDYLLDVEEDDPFEGLYYSDAVLDCVENMKLWFSMQKWYSERNIPWRRGALFHSKCGATGKSSMAKAIAKTLGIPMYVFHLATMSDQEFIEKWESMDTPCMPLFEDFDTVFNKRENLTEHKRLTFECILNQISGVQSRSGILLIVTTNRIECIDEALGVACDTEGTMSTRPGRIDEVIEFGMLSELHKFAMARSILRDWPKDILSVVASSGEVTPMQFNELCVQRAYDRLAVKRSIVELVDVEPIRQLL
jgi:SpoVK/Ycf46/Vps4 family AAA+-type ATPase